MKNSDPEAITIIIISTFYCATSVAVQSTVGFVKSRKSIKEIPMVHEGWPVVWTPFCFASLRMLNSNRCGFNLRAVRVSFSQFLLFR